MHGKVIQISKHINGMNGDSSMDSLDLDILDGKYFNSSFQHIYDSTFDCTDKEEYEYDVKGFLNFLAADNCATVNISPNIDDGNNYFTVSADQRENYLAVDKEKAGIFDSPAIYITYRTKTMECYKIFSLYDWFRKDVEIGQKYYLGPIMDVHN